MGKKHFKVFYGWWIVGACFLIAFYIGGVIFYGFTAIFEPIANEFGWSYRQISLAASLRGLEIGLLAPILGILVDRWGPRRLIFGGVIIIGSGLILLSCATSLGMFYVAFILVAIGIGPCTNTVLIPAVANWFRRRASIAIGIMICGFGFSGLLVPIVVELINLFGWRKAVVILGLSAWVICLPLSLVVRHKPEQYGYLANDEVKRNSIDEGPTPAEATDVHIGTKQILRSRVFWHIAIAQVSLQMILGSVVTHVMPYLSSIGIARVTSGLVAGAIPLASIPGRLGFGWLGSRFENRRVTAGSFTLMSLSLVCFEYAYAEAGLLVPFIILFGIGYGGSTIIMAVLLRGYVGTSNFGTIYGFLMGLGMVGQIVGPFLTGWVFDNWGSYQGIWLAFAGLAVVALIVITTIPQSGK